MARSPKIETPKNGAEFDELAGIVIGRLKEGLRAGAALNDDDITLLRISATVLSAYTRHLQTFGAREAVHFMMARELAADREQLAEYIRLTMPKTPLAKVLPEKAG